MTKRFEILDTPLDGLQVLNKKLVSDGRGYLERLFCEKELQALVPGKVIAQINRTLTTSRGTVRGFHFQYPPYAEIKFVNCLRGKVFDVAVDIRKSSPTFLCWHAEVLSDDNQRTLVIPAGFAHGFQTLTDDCELLYFHTVAHESNAEGGLNVEDPRLTIRWPLPVSRLSARDASQPMLVDDFTGVEL